jgi:hypothetical protein
VLVLEGMPEASDGKLYPTEDGAAGKEVCMASVFVLERPAVLLARLKEREPLCGVTPVTIIASVAELLDPETDGEGGTMLMNDSIVGAGMMLIEKTGPGDWDATEVATEVPSDRPGTVMIKDSIVEPGMMLMEKAGFSVAIEVATVVLTGRPVVAFEGPGTIGSAELLTGGAEAP